RRVWGRRLPGRAVQPPAIAGGDRPAPRDECLEARELAAAERSGEVGELDVDARGEVLALVVVAQVAHARDEARRPRHRPALARREELGRVERADRQRARATLGPGVVMRAERLGTVLDDWHAEGQERREIDGQAEGVR